MPLIEKCLQKQSKQSSLINEIIYLLNACISQNYFCFENIIYIQKGGVPISIFFIGSLEQETLNWENLENIFDF